MLMTLRLNEIRLVYSQSELIELGLGVASGRIRYDEILSWIQSHEG